MTITFQCRNCRATHHAKADHAGQHAKCPKCGEGLIVPHPTGAGESKTLPTPLLSVTCGCGKTLQARAEHAGKRARCPACGAALRIPTLTAPRLVASPQPKQETPIMASAVKEHANDAIPAEVPQVVCPHCESVVPGDRVFCSVCRSSLAAKKRVRLDDVQVKSLGRSQMLLLGVSVSILTFVSLVLLLGLSCYLIGSGVTFLVCIVISFVWAPLVGLLLACRITGEEKPEINTAIKIIFSSGVSTLGARFAMAGVSASLADHPIIVWLLAWILAACAASPVFCLLLDVHFGKGMLIYTVYNIISAILFTLSVLAMGLLVGLIAATLGIGI